MAPPTAPGTPLDAAAATAWIDAYLAGLPEDQRAALQALRATIAEAAPAADEGVSYGLPAFRYRGRPLVSYTAATSHCSFFPMGPEILDRYRPELEGFSMAKGTVRFTPQRPLPADVVKRIVRDRVAMIDAKLGGVRPQG